MIAVRLIGRATGCVVIGLAMILSACGGRPASSETTAPEREVDPGAAAIHARLFAAADAGQVAEFKALLTRSSIRMMDEWFAAQSHVLHTPDGPDSGWPGFVALHAALSSNARRRAPYPVDETDDGLRLNLTAHPDAAFFRAATLRLTETKLVE